MSQGLRGRLERVRLIQSGWGARPLSQGGWGGGPGTPDAEACPPSARLGWISRWGRDRGHGHHPPGPARILGLMVWIVFLIIPVLSAITNRGSAEEHVLAIAGAAAFSVVYVWLVMTWFEQESPRRSLALAGVMLALAVALTIADRPSWGFLFTYCAACVGLVLRSDLGMPAVILCAGAALGTTLIAGGSGGAGAGYAASAVGIGLLLVLMRDLRMRNHELLEARSELALSAVAEERERFARDLHDLLGHSLSVIAIKAELARRLLQLDPGRAAAEVADVERVARESLREVRQAVSGYRQPTLDKELEGARVALSAAGIEAEVERAPITLDPEVEAVLAWTVREGATNVIRHSGATHCQVRVRAGLADAGVEVVDDGLGPACLRGASGEAGEVRDHIGNGIIGLTERAERLRGRIEAGGLPEGHGFRLAVSIPVSAATG